MSRTVWIIIGVVVAVAVVVGIVVVATDGGEISESGAGQPSPVATDVSGTVSVMAVWSGDEQASFQAVIDGFNELYPNVNVEYTGAGDQLPTVLSTAVQGGSPPSVAAVAQPGLMRDFVNQGVLKPLDFASDVINENYSPSTIEVGTVDDTLYGLLFKGANKSTVWYNVPAFEDAGVTPPTTWDELLQGAETLNASGVKAYSIGGADGWTLTDLFENIYLRTAGPDLYDQLTAHDIPWTDDSVTTALEAMAQVLGDTGNIAGGTSGALQTDFPKSVSQVFSDPPAAAMVFEGDFVQGEILNSTDAEPETGFNQFAFPAINDSPPSVVGGGDMIIAFDDDPATQAFVQYLATPEASEIWASRGGFSSPNTKVDTSVYPDSIAQATAEALANAEVFRFDMSDLAPSAFGGTVGQGEWKILQDFLQDPSDVQGTQRALERAAAQAYGQ
ncbi:MAG: extracellular solute-binding protein [Actinobacteria bacterium]|nr:extracellular solute-binding protein [Actinomycetota bacterium]